jgi:two-component system sensor histidine kinase HydH
MTQVLSTKGAALIRAVEAGTRTGMKGLKWGGRQVQRLLEETAQLPDVRYVAVIQSDGTVLAHSDAERVGRPFRLDDGNFLNLGPDLQENFEILTLDSGARVFEIHRHFRPMVRSRPMHRRHMQSMMGHHGRGMLAAPKDWFDPQKPQPLFIIAGLEMVSFEQAIQRQLRQTVVLSVLLLLLGFAGFVALFWMQSYRMAQRSLQDTSVFANEVVAHLPVGLIATDPQGRIAFFNTSAEQISGISKSSALGQLPDQVMPHDACGLNALLKQGRTVREQEMVCSFGDKQNIPVSVSATRIVNELDQLVGHVLIIRDLGEVRRLQEAIRRQEKLAALGGMAAGVAHEIRNPLSSIKGLATYLAGKFGPESDDRDAARVMVQEVDRLNRVISELLEFARPSDITPQAMDVGALLQHSLKLIQQDAATKEVQIQLNVQGGLCRALIDPDRFSQCLLNLYLNAIQAMPDGGRLTIGCAREDSGVIKLEISDTGKGISEKHIGEIFNPYFTTKPSGTGLGLAIVHKIVDGHGGRIAVQSSPDGTTFALYLPCSSQGEDDVCVE